MYNRCTAPTSSPKKNSSSGRRQRNSKKWAKAKTFFGALYKVRRSYENNMKAHRSSFETSNRLTENPWHGSERSMSERSTDTAATKATTKSPTNKWVEYSNSLEDSLLRAKEYTSAITPKAESDQTSIMAELKEQRKQIQLELDQNTKLMAMLVKSGMGGKSTYTTRDFRKKMKEECVCKNCKKSGYHEDDNCFTLEKNANKRPA